MKDYQTWLVAQGNEGKAHHKQALEPFPTSPLTMQLI